MEQGHAEKCGSIYAGSTSDHMWCLHLWNLNTYDEGVSLLDKNNNKILKLL